jgi:hypothetical protein
VAVDVVTEQQVKPPTDRGFQKAQRRRFRWRGMIPHSRWPNRLLTGPRVKMLAP